MFSQEQERIHVGLKEIGPSIANYYLDAVRLIDPNCTLSSKANLVAHLLREIDGGLRDVFAPTDIQNIHERKFKQNGQEKMKHFSSILAAVRADDPNDKIAKEWYSIASNFHIIAHRHGVYKDSKDTQEILDLWGRFEKILGRFIGSYYSILGRLDGFLSLKEPPKDAAALPSLWNILTNPKHAFYFFTRLKEPGWIIALREAGFYELTSAPIKGEASEFPEVWLPIMSLANVSSEKLSISIENEIKTIVGTIIAGYLGDKIDLHHYTISDIAKIVLHIPSIAFTEETRKFFEKYDIAHSKNIWAQHPSILTKELPEKFYVNNDSESFSQLFLYVLGFETYSEEAIQIGDIVLDPTIQVKPFLDEHYVRDFVSNYGEKTMRMLGVTALHIVIDQLRKLNAVDSYGLSSHSIPSIEESDQTYFGDSWRYHLVCFVRDYSSILPTPELQKEVDEMVNSEVQILQRLAIHIIRVNYAVLSDLWWKFISLYDGWVYIHEPYLLIQETSTQYGKEEFEKTVTWIEKSHPIADDAEDGINNLSVLDIRRWLSAVRAGSEEVQILLNDKIGYYAAINSAPFEHPSFDSYMTTTFGYDAPISVDEFDAFTVERQAQYLLEYQPTNDYANTEQGLSDVFRTCVFNNPDKYLFSLSLFLPVHTFYLHSLIRGFSEAFDEARISDISLIASFVLDKVHSDAFNNEQPKNRPSKGWFVSSIAEFIGAIAKNKDASNLSKEFIIQLTEILINLSNREEFREQSGSIDNSHNTYVLNSVQGKLHQSLIDISKLWGKLFVPVEINVRWPENVKDYFTERLTRKADSDNGFSVILGKKILTLLYLDKEWVYSRASEIFPIDNPQHFDFTLTNAMSDLNRMSKELYSFFKANNLFVLALDRITHQCSAMDRIAKYGLFEWKELGNPLDKDSIIEMIINRRNIEQIASLVHQIRTLKVLAFDDMKIIWRKLLTVFNGDPAYENGYMMTLWFYDFAPGLDAETHTFLDTTLRNISRTGTVFYFLLKNIIEKADTNLELSAQLLKNMIKKNLVHVQYENGLIGFVEKLYSTKNEHIANEICLAVSDSGSVLLKDVYNSHNI